MVKDSYVSIIIPVYNAADTLHTCLAALEKQSYDYLELIFVNDCSQDASLHVIEDFEKAMGHRDNLVIKVINHEANQGVAAARNSGLEHAGGDYIYYVDADDRLDENAIELAIHEAERTGADIIGFDWYLAFAKKERLMRQPYFSTPHGAITQMLNGRMRWNLWLFLVKRSLYEKNRIRFIPKMNMGEDMMVMFKLFSLAERVSYLPLALYHYGQLNPASLTKVYSDKHIQEVTENIKEVERFFLTGVHAEYVGEKLGLLKLNIKLPLLISNQNNRYQKWCTWFPEVNKYAWRNNVQSLRIRLIQWGAWRKQFWMIKLHYYLIIRMVYGVLYK
ncbi:glycosyltransferase family 2 protein [Sphingobacterium phlebotomi]|uniref:Glycosyltransferase family 2 protein n=1 Tax=Sphingobacterium phlebotomi TaxID=2605433 RepID=A0A5D4H6Y3_9SPHI|nr:glycosyltransferase family A protein [Sphingobacterium phlebotomi]TYR36526.1 glycosyltransferase family 2 protein [Sphingobacterium phlebotomi]